jgi:hypothetical protein
MLVPSLGFAAEITAYFGIDTSVVVKAGSTQKLP